jgi:hypothetical protein
MKTKEIQSGIEVWADDDFASSASHPICLECCFYALELCTIECTPELREDQRDVFFIEVDVELVE